MAQSPMISIPKKSTDDVDWQTPIQILIAQSYGERPESYATECQNLQRCRQDAVKGAGSDMTGRDLLYKYFGQLELLELRFSEIKVAFPWRDAFTSKLTTQTSLAFEKASIIFMMAATHSAIGAQQSRADPEALKRSVHYFRSAAGMLNYINENFLHAPSTDLSKEVVQFLVGVMLAQATESVFEKCVQERGMGNALIAKIGAQTASMYTQLTEDVKDFMGKGIFDRNWVTLIQIKAKLFTSLMHYYRALADEAQSKHGECLVRLTVAENNAKEAHRTATTLTSYFVTSLSPNLPSDAGSSILEMTKTHLSLVSEKKRIIQKDNDLIYNAVLPAEGTLPVIEKTVVAQPITIQEVYASPAVQKTIGPDIFQRLIPLSVHEGASVYSEEKAKLVRSEVEKAEIADEEVKAGLESIGVRSGLGRFKEMIDTTSGGEVDPLPPTVKEWREEIAGKESLDVKLRELENLRGKVEALLNDSGRQLEVESRECEAMRIRYEHLWTQAPSASLSKTMRQDLKSQLTALEQARVSDEQCIVRWNEMRAEVILLTDFNGRLEACFRDDDPATKQDLLGIGPDATSSDDAEKERITSLVKEIDDKMGKINKLTRERNEALKDLKDKIQSDDVSHILLLNRRGGAFEPGLFAQELEKFKPTQQRLAATSQQQQALLQEVAQLWRNLKDFAGRGTGARKWEERERKKMDTVRRFAHAREACLEVFDGVAKGLQFYHDLLHGATELQENVTAFVRSRNGEREDLASQAEVQKRLAAAPSVSAPAPPPLPPPKPSQAVSGGLEKAFGGMSLGGSPSVTTPPASQPNYAGWQPPPAPPSQPSYPPPHQQQQPSNPYHQPPQSNYQQQPSASYPPPPQHTQQPVSAYPPPPPAPHSYQTSYNNPSVHAPQRQSSLMSPPPPPPPAPSAPPVDPYASLFNAPFMSPPSAPPSSGGYTPSSPPPPPPNMGYGSSPPPPPPQQQQQQQAGSPYYQPRNPVSPPPPPPQQNQYPSYMQPISQQGAFPPPPPPITYQSQVPQGAPPPPQQQAPSPYGAQYGAQYGVTAQSYSQYAYPQQQQQQQPPPPPQQHHYPGYPNYQR